MTLATIGADGQPHLTAMWYGLVDGKIVFWSYRPAQKMKNLERDPRLTVLVESGDAYSELPGVSIAGRAVILDDPDDVVRIGQAIGERYSRPGTDTGAAAAASAPKRVAVRVEPDKVATWDHTKLAGVY